MAVKFEEMQRDAVKFFNKKKRTKQKYFTLDASMKQYRICDSPKIASVGAGAKCINFTTTATTASTTTTTTRMVPIVFITIVSRRVAVGGAGIVGGVQDMAQELLESQLQQSVLAGPTRIREGVFSCKDAEVVRHAGSTQMGSFGSGERLESSFTVNSDQQAELEKSAAGGNLLETVDIDSYKRDIGPIFDFLFPKVVSAHSPVISNRATDIVQPSDLRGKLFGEDVEREETIETRDNLISRTVGTASNLSVLAEFDSLIWGIAEAGDALNLLLTTWGMTLSLKAVQLLALAQICLKLHVESARMLSSALKQDLRTKAVSGYPYY